MNVRNFSSGVTANRRVTLTLLDPGPLAAGPWLLAGDSVAQFTDTNGLTTFSNVLAGGYRLDIAGTPSRSFPLGMPDTNGVTLNAATLIGATNTNPYFYTAAQIDSLLVPNGFVHTNEPNPLLFTNAANQYTGAVTNIAASPSTIAAYDANKRLGSMANGGGNAVLHGATPPAYSAVVESDLSLSDVTIANANTSAHGLLPKLDNNAAHYLDGTGAFSTPPVTGTNGLAGTNTWSFMVSGGLIITNAVNFTGEVITTNGAGIFHHFHTNGAEFARFGMSNGVFWFYASNNVSALQIYPDGGMRTGNLTNAGNTFVTPAQMTLVNGSDYIGLNGSVFPGTDAADDLGIGGHRFRNLQLSGTAATALTTANTITVTNAPTFQQTNTAPTSTTIGTTAPDLWLTITNNGNIYFSPIWKNH